MQLNPLYQSVEVEAFARLHLGFIDLHGGFERRFGSLGLTLDGISTRICISPSNQLVINSGSTTRIEKVVRTMCESLNIAAAIQLRALRLIPHHVGLGSGTQLSLCAGTAIERLYGLGLLPRDIALICGRGVRSGIGIGAFEHGGFLMDSGCVNSDDVPTITTRLDFPQDWRIALIMDRRAAGLHGQHEVDAFNALSEFTEAKVAYLCGLIMMRLLPAIQEHNFAEFSRSVGEMQSILGEYFAPVQGGVYTSAAVGGVIAYLQTQGIEGVGQSSWGPTGFAFLDSECHAANVMQDVKRRFSDFGQLTFQLVAARNQGSSIYTNELCMKKIDAVH